MVLTTQTTKSKGISADELKELFSDFGKEFSMDIPDIAKALDDIMMGYLFSFQDREIELTDAQYDTIHYVNWLRTYMSEKLIEYATGKKRK